MIDTVEQLPVISLLDEAEEKALEIDGSKSSKAKKPGGTFASMGLSRPIIRAVERKGYKLATPIQRKCIPHIMQGKDVVAMARTGSGKSASFLLPLIDKLKMRQPKAEIRALVLSPTRELAMQTFRFVRDFAKYTNLTSKLIIGGESISRDFETITSRPDILIATPGRLAHVLVEMKQKLDGIEIIVFDEADRLFEPGFKEMEQVNEICSRLNDTKQTLLFSATMPQKLADFAKAGLKDPVFIRLDVEANLSETLKSVHLHCNQHDKFAVLLYLLKKFVTEKDQMTVVFMPTRHHIEYAKMLLDNSRLQCCYVYSSMDPEARRINIEKFTRKHCKVLLVTDIAARGIDIPLLDIVINFNFPFKPKLYVHRVGRVARAGKFGCAISLVSHDETPYLHALHMFLDESVKLASELTQSSETRVENLSQLPDKILGSVPQGVLDDENEILKKWHEHNEDLKAMVKVCDNAMKPYLKTREPPQPNSVKVSKDIHRKVMGEHPLFRMTLQGATAVEKNITPTQVGDQNNLLDRIKSYKPQATIFEVGHIKGNQKQEAFGVMQKKRQYHDKIAQKRANQSGVSESDLVDDKEFEDDKFYLKYRPEDYVKEKGLELDKNTFDHELKRATFDLVADDEDQMKSQRHQMIWDRKKKKYVRAGDDEKKTKKIRTESGAYISASYSSGLYEKWKNHSKVDQRDSDNDDFEDDQDSKGLKRLKSKLKPTKRTRRELKNPEEMLKERNIKEKREAILRIKTMKKAERKAGGGGGKRSKPGVSSKFNPKNANRNRRPPPGRKQTNSKSPASKSPGGKSSNRSASGRSGNRATGGKKGKRGSKR